MEMVKRKITKTHLHSFGCSFLLLIEYFIAPPVTVLLRVHQKNSLKHREASMLLFLYLF